MLDVSHAVAILVVAALIGLFLLRKAFASVNVSVG